ncbi:hypothetical protein DEA98_25355 [Brucella pseudogrignonensis]|nr:hypothetical protein [Brucella pseudogrignonensis]
MKEGDTGALRAIDCAKRRRLFTSKPSRCLTALHSPNLPPSTGAGDLAPPKSVSATVRRPAATGTELIVMIATAGITLQNAVFIAIQVRTSAD